MRLLLAFALVAVLAVTWAGIRDHTVTAHAAQQQLTWRQNEILVERAKTHACTDRLGRPRFRVQERIVRGGPAYRRWVLRLWQGRARLYCKAAADLSDPVRAIYAVFGAYGAQAVRVAHCETGGTYSVYARNGQFLGLFQMGSYARGRYGHSWTPLGQARAAYRYFVDSGRDWSPWECKP